MNPISLDDRNRLAEAVEKIRMAIPCIAAFDLGYPAGAAVVRPPAMTRGLSDSVSPSFPDQSSLLAFYELCDGIDLPDIHNGIFLHSSEMILASDKRMMPVKLRSGGAIRVFGTDGGGQIFCTSTHHGRAVIQLRAGSVVDGEFDDIRSPARTVAGSFCDFLDRILEDAIAFVEGRPG